VNCVANKQRNIIETALYHRR